MFNKVLFCVLKCLSFLIFAFLPLSYFKLLRFNCLYWYFMPLCLVTQHCVCQVKRIFGSIIFNKIESHRLKPSVSIFITTFLINRSLKKTNNQKYWPERGLQLELTSSCSQPPVLHTLLFSQWMDSIRRWVQRQHQMCRFDVHGLKPCFQSSWC